MNSPTMAPTVASVIATLSAPNRCGSACGRRSRKKMFARDAPIDRIRNTESRSTERIPTTVSIMIGKKAIRSAISTLGMRPKPSQITSSGPSATFGTTCTTTSHG